MTGEGGDPTKIWTSPFQPEDGKKSSFLLSESSTIPHPASVDVRYVQPSSPTENPQIFFLGGFQLVANAKSFEIYLTEKDGKESYLTTSKGIVQPKGENGEEWQKAVCVIPGGPRPILKLKIKLLSLKPTGSSQAKVRSLKLTARLPEKATTAKSNAPRSNAPTLLSPTEGVPPIGGSFNHITTDDLGAAMASMSILARSTESSIESSLTEKFNHLDKSIQTRCSVLEHHIGELVSVVSAQRTAIEKQAKLLEVQQEQIRNQAQQMEQLIGQHKLDSQTFHDIRTYFSSLRNSNNGGPSRISRGLNLTIPTTTAEEEPSERGIEQTLSNLELSDRREHDIGGHFLTGEGTDATEATEKILETAADSSMNQAVEVPEGIERIEVSLSESDQETLAGRIHEEEGARDVVPPLQSSQYPGMLLAKNASMARPSRSFEDRNDKNEKKEVPANGSDTVQLEVLAVGEDETFEVMESTTADEHERSPPELNVESKIFD